MAATGYTPIYLYYSSTATNQPSAGNLGYGELALNITDKNLFFKDNTNAVNTVPIRQSSGSSNGWLSSTDWTTFNSKAPAVTYTSNYIPYGQGTTTPALSAGLKFDGTNFTTTGIASAASFVPTSSTVPTNGMYYPSANALGISTNTTNAVFINASQQVGIGTTSPTSGVKLDVNGTIKIGTGTSASAGCIFSNANYGMLFQAFQASPGQADFVWFNSAQVERMRISPSGGVSIGNTTDPGAANLSVNGLGLFGTTSANGQLTVTSALNTRTCARMFVNAASSQSQPAIYLDKYDNTTTTSQVFVAFTINNQGVGSGQINANGTNQAAFGSFSDRRLKENIVDLPPQLDNINALRPVEFDYIESEGGGHQISFIAQEMQNVYPDAVGERADGMLTVTGWGKTEARLVKAIQELTQRIIDLENK